MVQLQEIPSSDHFASDALALIEVFDAILSTREQRRLFPHELAVCQAPLTKSLNVAVVAPRELITTGLELSEESFNGTLNGMAVVNVPGLSVEEMRSVEMSIFGDRPLFVENNTGVGLDRIQIWQYKQPDADGVRGRGYVAAVKGDVLVSGGGSVELDKVVMMIDCVGCVPGSIVDFSGLVAETE